MSRSSAPAVTWAHEALSGASPTVFWLDRGDAPEPEPTLDTTVTADLAVVGAGFTGLWAALQAAEASPGRRIVVVDAGAPADGASGRNGGFCDASLTHGLANGESHWPDEQATLLRLGDENWDGLLDTVARHAIDADVERTGAMDVATDDWQLEGLAEAAELCHRHGLDAELLDARQAQEQLHSPTYRGGLVRPDGVAVLDPARLAWGLRAAARAAGVRFHDHSTVRGLDAGGRSGPVRVQVDGGGAVDADRVVIATNAYPSPLRRARPYVVPVWDYVLVTEPLDAAQLASVGWSSRCGMSDAGNQFHYYRLTADNRILWGGYDAIYPFGSRLRPADEQREETQRLLAEQFFTTFPQLEGLRFAYRWGGPIATTTRFTASWGTAMGGRVAWIGGYTGLGVGASRFGARVALDLVDGVSSERTELAMVRKRPLPFPPEPLRWVGVALTRRSLQAADRNGGRRNLWLRTLDRFGVGFDS